MNQFDKGFTAGESAGKIAAFVETRNAINSILEEYKDEIESLMEKYAQEKDYEESEKWKRCVYMLISIREDVLKEEKRLCEIYNPSRYVVMGHH